MLCTSGAPAADTVERPVRGQAFTHGLRSGLPVAVGYLPIALAFGVLARTADVGAGQAAAMSALVFAGASQFMAINLIAAGASPATIVIATFVVNLRHFVMSASLSRRLRLKWWQAAVVGFGITDETFVVSSLAKPSSLPTAFVLGVNTAAYLAWVLGSWAGAAFSHLIPRAVTKGMEIALYAMFIGLLVPAVRREPRVGVIAAGSGALCWALGHVVPAGWAVVSAALAAAGISSLLLGKEVDGR